MATNHQMYMMAVAEVLQKAEARRRGMRTLGRTVRLAQGIPFKFLGYPVAGPQCVTVSLRIEDDDLGTVLKLGERLAHRANSQFARVYRDLNVVRVEFTLPPEQWRLVEIGNLPHHRESITVGQRALGPVARLDWTNPHKAIFGSSQTGKTTCLADMIISLARSSSPDEVKLLILNPKNDPAFEPFRRLRHLAAGMATVYEACVGLLRFALREMTDRKGGVERYRLVVIIDEVAQLTKNVPETGPIITQLSQMAGGLRINLVVASQAANPSTFGSEGSLAQANFQSRLVFQLPHAQAYLATNLPGQHPEKLGGSGDGLAINGDKVTRFRAGLPRSVDYEGLTRNEVEPSAPEVGLLAGDAAITQERWQVDPDRLAYAMIMRDSATAIQKQFGGGTDRARMVRDYAVELRERANYWVQIKKGEAGR